MAGLLNEARLLWKGTSLEKLSRLLLGVYKRKNIPPLFYTPYQFTLPILQALYHRLAGDFGPDVDIVSNNESAVLKGINPLDRAKALTKRVRAIGYYSWEPETRLFLVRRMFPTYFDFLSVSHIPEGWGASSVMLNELRKSLAKGSNPVRNGHFFTVFKVKGKGNLPYALPYMAEQKRLKYDCILVLPVFKKSVPIRSDREMLGAFVCFLSRPGTIRKASKAPKFLKTFLQSLCNSMSEIVELHNDKLKSSQPPLPEAWRQVRLEMEERAGIAEIVFRCHDYCPMKPVRPGSTCDTLESIAGVILHELSGSEYYALRDLHRRRGKKHTAVILVVARADIKIHFQKRLLQLITNRLANKHITCDVTIKQRDNKKTAAFHLETDHNWTSANS